MLTSRRWCGLTARAATVWGWEDEFEDVRTNC